MFQLIVVGNLTDEMILIKIPAVTLLFKFKLVIKKNAVQFKKHNYVILNSNISFLFYQEF